MTSFSRKHQSEFVFTILCTNVFWCILYSNSICIITLGYSTTLHIFLKPILKLSAIEHIPFNWGVPLVHVRTNLTVFWSISGPKIFRVIVCRRVEVEHLLNHLHKKKQLASGNIFSFWKCQNATLINEQNKSPTKPQTSPLLPSLSACFTAGLNGGNGNGSHPSPPLPDELE